MSAKTPWAEPATYPSETHSAYCNIMLLPPMLCYLPLLPSTSTFSLSYISDIMHMLKLYNELMNYAPHSMQKVQFNQYLEHNSTTLSIHLLNDLQIIQDNQGHWTQQGNLDMETILKEIKDSRRATLVSVPF